jgi:hypothetical protein
MWFLRKLNPNALYNDWLEQDEREYEAYVNYFDEEAEN